MVVISSEYDKVSVLTLKGKLMSPEDCQVLQDRVDGVLNDKSQSIVINLKQLNWISSMGIGALMRCMTKTQKAKAELRLAGLTEKVQNIFSITKIDNVIKIFPTVNEAVESF